MQELQSNLFINRLEALRLSAAIIAQKLTDKSSDQLGFVCRQCCRAVQSGYCALYLVVEKGESLILRAENDPGFPFPSVLQARNTQAVHLKSTISDIIEAVAISRVVTRYKLEKPIGNLQCSSAEFKVDSLIAVPIIGKTELTGLLVFLNKVTEKTEFDQFDEYAAEILGNLISVAFHTRGREDPAQAKYSYKLQEADFLRAIVDNAGCLIFAKDEHSRFTFVNQVLADLYGTDASGLLGQTDAAFCPSPIDVARFREDDLNVLGEAGRMIIDRESVTGRDGIQHIFSTAKIRHRTPDGRNLIVGLSIPIDSLVAAELHLVETRNLLSEERFLLHALMENLPDGIYCKAANKKFRRVNRAQARFLGVESVENAVGHVEGDFLELETAKLERDENQLLRDGVTLSNKVLSVKRKKDDHHFYLSRTEIAIRDSAGNITGIIGITKDVSQEVLGIEGFSKHLFQQILDAIPIGIFWKDTSLKYRGCNDFYLKTFGFESFQELVGRRENELQNRSHVDRYSSYEEAALQNHQKILHMRDARLVGGSRRVLNLCRIPLDDLAGKPIGILGTTEDITSTLDHYEQLVQFISHTLNQRVCVLESNFSPLKSQHPNSGWVGPMEVAIDVMKHAVARARSFSVLSGRDKPKDVDITQLLVRLRLVYGVTGVLFEIQKDVRALAEVFDLESAILELIGNAITHGARVGQGNYVKVKLEKDNTSVRIHVEDNGPGVKRNQEGFAASTRPRRIGIGLALAKFSVEKMGGTLTQVKENSPGAHFVITLNPF